MSHEMSAPSPSPLIFVSSNCLAGGRDLSSVLTRLAAIGVHNVELSGGHSYSPPAVLLDMLETWRDQGMRFTVHNYFPAPQHSFVLNIASFAPEVHEQSLSLMEHALDFSMKLQTPFYGVHAGYLADATEAEGRFHFRFTHHRGMKDCMHRAVETIGELLQKRGEGIPPQGLLIENLFPPATGCNQSLCTTPQELASFFEIANSEGINLGFLLDLAHLDLTCRRQGSNPDAILEQILGSFGNRLKSVHLSGHDGVDDVHRAMCPRDWQLRAVRRIAQFFGSASSCFTLECRGVDEPTVLAQIDLLRQTLASAE